MNNISEYTKGLIILLFIVFSSSFIHGNEAYPGENLIKNEQLLKARVESMNTIFDFKYTEEFKQRLSFILKTKPVYTKSVLGRMVMYFPQIDSIFDANGIPSDLKYITYIESSLNPYARSRAGAVGMWQFMEGTAKFMGIRVNRAVDERKDPYASTHAAVKYFNHLYEIYGDWALVLQAYNSGPGRVNRAIAQAGTSDFDEIQKYLPRETREYIPKFLAAVFFFKNYKEFNIEPSWPDLDLQITTRRLIHEKVSFSELEQMAEFKDGTLTRLNPSYRYKYIPKSKRGYYLVLPKRFSHLYDSLMVDIDEEIISEEVIVVSEDSLMEENLPKFLDPYYRIKYRVKSGQTLQKIAELTNSSPYHLKYWNQKSSNTIFAGEYLIVFLPKSIQNEQRLMYISQNNIQSLIPIEIQNLLISQDLSRDILEKLAQQENNNESIQLSYKIDDKHHENAIFLLNHVFSSK